jgi:hypothetical protein
VSLVTHEKVDAGGGLDVSDDSTERRLGDVDTRSRAAEVKLLRHRDERIKLP